MHFISSAMASFCLETTVEDAMQTVRDAGFDSLDFPLSVYSRPQDAPLRGDDWRQWARGINTEFYYMNVVESGNSFYNFSLHIFLLITTVISITGILAVIS